MLRLVSLFVCSLLLVGCLSTPGIEEPEIVQCTILIDTADCVNPDGTYTEVPLSEMSGFIAVSPGDYSGIKNHHDALHTKLNQCIKDKCK